MDNMGIVVLWWFYTKMARMYTSCLLVLVDSQASQVFRPDQLTNYTLSNEHVGFNVTRFQHTRFQQVYKPFV